MLFGRGTVKLAFCDIIYKSFYLLGVSYFAASAGYNEVNEQRAKVVNDLPGIFLSPPLYFTGL